MYLSSYDFSRSMLSVKMRRGPVAFYISSHVEFSTQDANFFLYTSMTNAFLQYLYINIIVNSTQYDML